jgi:hypothetical protein
MTFLNTFAPYNNETSAKPCLEAHLLAARKIKTTYLNKKYTASRYIIKKEYIHILLLQRFP